MTTTPTTQREADEREQSLDLDHLEAQVQRAYMADARCVAFLSPGTILALIAKARAATDQPSAGLTDERAEVPATYMTPAQAFKWAWNTLKKELGADRWNAGDEVQSWAFFKYGWDYKTQYEKQARASLTPTAPQAASQQEDAPPKALYTFGIIQDAPQATSTPSASEICAQCGATDKQQCRTTNPKNCSYPNNLSPQAVNIEGYSIKHVEGHGWLIDPPQGSRWVAFEDTPAGDFVAAIMKRAPQAATTASASDGELLADLVPRGLTFAGGRRVCLPVDLLRELMGRAPVQAAQPALPAEPVMADGKTKLSDYLENVLPDDRLGDDWTKGFEECKRRLFKVVGAQLRSLAAPGAAQTTDAREGGAK